MRLNPDCLRDILLTIEEHVDFGGFLNFPPRNPVDFPLLSKYPEETVRYHIRQCELAGLIYKVSWVFGGSCLVRHLTPSGHEFIENIRANNNWAKTKKIAQEAGSFSLNALMKIATNVISSVISGNFSV